MTKIIIIIELEMQLILKCTHTVVYIVHVAENVLSK